MEFRNSIKLLRNWTSLTGMSLIHIDIEYVLKVEVNFKKYLQTQENWCGIGKTKVHANKKIILIHCFKLPHKHPFIKV